MVISPFFYFQVYRSKPSRVNPYFIYYMDVIGLYYRHQNPRGDPQIRAGSPIRTRNPRGLKILQPAPHRSGAVR
jgi:hypothetical protein